MAARTRLTILLAVLLAACGPAGPDPSSMPPLPVGVITAQQEDVPLFVELVGTTMGAQDVPIRARVEGFLETMNFREGGFVEEGTLLYTIDAQPFQAKLVEAQSQLATSRTNLVKAQSDLDRIRPLAEIDAVSQQDLDGAVAQEAAARSSVRAADAAVQLAEIELSYTRLVAPIDGLIGLSKARPGEFVGRDPNPVVLAVLSDIEPIRVRFSVAEREYLEFDKGATPLRPLHLPEDHEAFDVIQRVASCDYHVDYHTTANLTAFDDWAATTAAHGLLPQDPKANSDFER